MTPNHPTPNASFSDKTALIWGIAEILRGSWKQHEYQDVILPLVVLKRLDDVLAETKSAVLERHNSLEGKIKDLDSVLKNAANAGFYNISPYDFTRLLDDPSNIAANFRIYLDGFSPDVKDIIEKLDFDKQLDRLKGGDLLFLIVKELNKVNLHPNAVDNHVMGSIFEELIRKFAEQSNETAGEHYTPREVIRVMAEVLFAPDQELLKRPHAVKTIYDCACGTGGMLSVAKDHIVDDINLGASVYLFGQELNPATYAICKADMLIKGDKPENIKGGEKDHSKASTLSNDQFAGQRFDYLLTNPPFGVDWKKDRAAVDKEYDRGYAGRFGAGLPRISDGQLLFLQHMCFKMRETEKGGARVAIVFNGSPLFTGDAGSGESEIRRWLMEKDWLEAIIALPDQLFYNTGISTYVWIISNRKIAERKGKVQLIDARELFTKRRKSLGNKRHDISDENRAEIVRLYSEFKNQERSKIFDSTDFAFRQITVERPLRLNFQASPERLRKLKDSKPVQTEIEKAPAKRKFSPDDVLTALETLGDQLFKNREAFAKALKKALKQADLKLPAPIAKTILSELSERDETADICLDADGNPEPDSALRDSENVPWNESVYDYFDREVKPFAPDAWINETVRDHKDGEVGKVGYEVPFTRHFYVYEQPRDLEEIGAEIKQVENTLVNLMSKI